MRILFMGTPDIAAECLKALYAAGHDICAVYTRRDKPVGRKQVLTAPPVKQVAMAHGTPVFQPVTLRDEAVQAAGGAGDSPKRLHQPARFAAAEISRQRPGTVVGAERRCRDRRFHYADG